MSEKRKVINSLNKLVATIIDFANGHYEIHNYLFTKKSTMSKEVIYENIKLLNLKKDILRKEYEFVTSFININKKLIDQDHKVNKLATTKKKLIKSIKAIDNMIIDLIILLVSRDIPDMDTSVVFEKTKLELD